MRSLLDLLEVDGLGERVASSGEDLFKDDEVGVIGKCPKCLGRGYFMEGLKTFQCRCDEFVNKRANTELSEQELLMRAKEKGIPEFYLGKEFDARVLKNDENLDIRLRNSMEMDYYISMVMKLYDSFVLGYKLSNSFLVMSPQGNSKSFLVYSCMIEALKKGWEVSPYYDTEEIYHMRIKRDSRLEEVLSSDVCFVKMLPAFLDKRDTQAVKYVMDKRARKNLPTVVTSRFNMAYIKEIEPHLENNFGLKNVERGDYNKLKEIVGAYPKDFSKWKR